MIGLASRERGAFRGRQATRISEGMVYDTSNVFAKILRRIPAHKVLEDTT